MEKRLEKLEQKVDTIMDNHLAHLKEDIFGIKEDLTATKTNVEWIQKFFWIVASSSIGALVAGIITLLK